MRERIDPSKRIVIKLGTQIVIRENGELAHDRLASLVRQCAELKAAGKDILLVSSGAVGLGRRVLKLTGPLELPEKQACAAVGQNLLMDVYRECFQHYNLVTAQVLLTASDFSTRERYLNLRDTLEKLLELGVIPIINENDTVSTTELAELGQSKSFGDNDKLSALVASKLEADLLVILTNVDGIYTDNPALNDQAKRIPVIERFEQIQGIAMNGQSTYGRGGMSTKVEAARIAAISGVNTLITSGIRENALGFLLNPDAPELPGTLVLAQYTLPGRKRWIGLASGSVGVVVVNEGARTALVEQHASLLPGGITAVHGEFKSKQVVSIQDESGMELGRGLVNFSSEDIRRIQGKKAPEVKEILGTEERHMVIRRDDLVIFQEYQR